MPYFKIEFSCNNAAFDDGGMELETARIIDDIRHSVLSGIVQDRIHDINGNYIGQWEFTGYKE